MPHAPCNIPDLRLWPGKCGNHPHSLQKKASHAPSPTPHLGWVPVPHVPAMEPLPAAILLSQLVLPGALRSAAHAMLILHSMGITGTNFGLLKAAQKLLFCPTTLLCFFPTGASVRRSSPPLLPASFSLAAPLRSLRPYPEFTTELEHVDNCVGRRTELLAFSAAINLAPV